MLVVIVEQTVSLNNADGISNNVTRASVLHSTCANGSVASTCGFMLWNDDTPLVVHTEGAASSGTAVHSHNFTLCVFVLLTLLVCWDRVNHRNVS